MKCKISAVRHNKRVATCGWLSTTTKTQICMKCEYIVRMLLSALAASHRVVDWVKKSLSQATSS